MLSFSVGLVTEVRTFEKVLNLALVYIMKCDATFTSKALLTTTE